MTKTKTVITNVNWYDPIKDPRNIRFEIIIDSLVKKYNKVVDELNKLKHDKK